MGSSQTSSVGSETIARAIETRCCWPPESSVGLCAGAVGQADELQRDRRALLALAPTTAWSAAAAARRCAAPRASASGCRTGTRSRPWRRATWRARRAPSWSMRWPPTVMLPPDGASRPPIRLSSVVLPEPDGPHQREEVALRDVEVDVVQHLDLLLAALVDLREVADLDQLGHARCRSCWFAARRRTECQCGASSIAHAPRRRAASGGGDSTTRSPTATPSGIELHRADVLRRRRDGALRAPCRRRRRRPRSCRRAATIACGGTSTPLRRRRRGRGLLAEEGHAHAHVGHEARVLLLERDAHLDRAPCRGRRRARWRSRAPGSSSRDRRRAPPRPACRA